MPQSQEFGGQRKRSRRMSQRTCAQQASQKDIIRLHSAAWKQFHVPMKTVSIPSKQYTTVDLISLPNSVWSCWNSSLGQTRLRCEISTLIFEAFFFFKVWYFSLTNKAHRLGATPPHITTQTLIHKTILPPALQTSAPSQRGKPNTPGRLRYCQPMPSIIPQGKQVGPVMRCWLLCSSSIALRPTSMPASRAAPLTSMCTNQIRRYLMPFYHGSLEAVFSPPWWHCSRSGVIKKQTNKKKPQTSNTQDHRNWLCLSVTKLTQKRLLFKISSLCTKLLVSLCNRWRWPSKLFNNHYTSRIQQWGDAIWNTTKLDRFLLIYSSIF